MKKTNVLLFIVAILTLCNASISFAADLFSKTTVHRVLDGGAIEIAYRGKKERLKLLA
jgi:hypothetical protein